MKRTDVYQKYIVTRTDGKEEPNAVYFVLRIDRHDHWWDRLGRRTLRHMARRLIKDGDPSFSEFGENLLNWIDGFALKEEIDDPDKR